MRFANLFFKEGAIEKANAAYKNRIAEINADSAAKAAVLEAEKIAAKAAFKDKLASNKAKRNEKFAKIDSATTADEAIAAFRS